ncbi:hypothetical protein [Nostoc sp. TCL26-01]|uniref:DUF6887 family protein n=1 Tax=Nostoc sp. TCL26-01 TaxID=2576904 RepID=UPI00277B5128|nr:hypothetical protein [Nostoc sp. TCL26-01]QLE57995.1 hypothetical protein FD725_22250 [Nostoc sp. TCL26-01]
MTLAKYQDMNLDELRRYVLTHREDTEAFYTYIDRSKSEGRMVSINPDDENWEEKVIEAIRYSNNSIRWYCDNTEKYKRQSQIITAWWNDIDNKFVTKYHTESIKHTGIARWKPDKLNRPVKFIISEPSLEVGQFTTLIKYRDENKTLNQIEAVAIDLDIEKQNLFVWTKTSTEVIIFSLETT